MTEIEYDNFPQEVKAIVDTYDDNENLYEECHRIQKELEHIGWTCDYGLDGEVYDVRVINRDNFVRIAMAIIKRDYPFRPQRLAVASKMYSRWVQRKQIRGSLK